MKYFRERKRQQALYDRIVSETGIELKICEECNSNVFFTSKDLEQNTFHCPFCGREAKINDFLCQIF